MTIIFPLDIWPSLASIVLEGLSLNMESADLLLPSFKHSLFKVRLNFQARPKIDFIDSLLQNPTQSLRFLE